MAAQPKAHMSVDEFLIWAEEQPGRHELYQGVVYAMAPERAGHAKTKHAVARALEAAIAKNGCTCWMLPDGMTVRIDAETAHEPDALVYCGAELPSDAIEVPNPVVVVEVKSPSTKRLDATLKLASYFKLPSVQHYLIVDPEGPPVIHHQRGASDVILTRIIGSSEPLLLDPPGLTIGVASFFNAA